MRYSEILTTVYHKIQLPLECQFWLDVHFTSAAHHLIRYRESDRDSKEESFHDRLFREHLYRLKEIVFTTGDFRIAVDPTGCNLHRRATWNPEYEPIIDPTMFNKMTSDDRFKVGQAHVSDVYLQKDAKIAS